VASLRGPSRWSVAGKDWWMDGQRRRNSTDGLL